jgi:hypothetical protein
MAVTTKENLPGGDTFAILKLPRHNDATLLEEALSVSYLTIFIMI